MEDLGELLELCVFADLREVAGDDEVIGAVLLCDAQRSCEPADARERVHAAMAEADELGREAVARPPCTRASIEDVNVGQMSDASHGGPPARASSSVAQARQCELGFALI